MSPFDLNIDERPTTSQIAPQARNDHDHDGDAARDEFAGMLADRSMNAPRRPPSPASSKGPMSWNEMSSAERQTSLLNDYERPEVDADEQVSPRRRAADAVSSAARTRDPDPSRDARRDALERHTDPRDASATTSETHRDAEVRRGDEARRARDLDPSRPTKVQDRGATSPQTRRTSKARDATSRARVQSQGTASSRSSDGPASAEPTSNARVATVGAPDATGTHGINAPGDPASRPTSNVAATAAAVSQPAAATAKEATNDGPARSSRASSRATTAPTNSTHSNHSRDSSHDHSRDSSQSRNAPSTTYASSFDSDSSTRTSIDSGLGVSPGSPTPPGSLDGPQPLPSADALRLIASSSALSTSSMELPPASLAAAAAPPPAAMDAIPQLTAPQGSDAAARAAAVEQLRAQVLQETARIRGFDGQATLHFSADGLGDFEMKVQRTEQGWEVVLRPRERQTDELLQGERRRIASALQDIDEDITFNLETSDGDQAGHRGGSSKREATLAAQRLKSLRPPPADTRPASSHSRTSRVLSPDGIVDVVV